MKKIKEKLMMFVLAFSVIIFIAYNKTAYADTVLFGDLTVSDDQLVQVLPEGGFIIKNDGSSDFDESIVAENGGVLMTYKEYQSYPEKESSISGSELFSIPTIGIHAVNPYSQTGKVLANNEAYCSAEFSGKGWRFSNYKFIAANGTGRYLRWTSLNDGGRVGHYREALDTYSGRGLYGVELPTGRSKYVDTQSDWLYYYTYNPAKGTKYFVENR